MISDRYKSWTLCGGSKLTQQMPLPLIPITTSFGMQPISMTSIKSRKDLRERHSPLNKKNSVTEFRQPLQVQSHLEMPRILVQLGHTQRTQKLAPQTDPKRSPTRSVTRYQDQISVKCTRWTLRMPSFTRTPHAQPSLSNFTRRDSDFGEPTRSRGTT